MISHTRLLTIAFALALVVPSFALTPSTAQAGPFDVLSESREGGKREHKAKKRRKRRKKKKRKTRNDDSDARSQGRYRTGRTRPAGSGETGERTRRDGRRVDRYRTGRTRPAGSDDDHDDDTRRVDRYRTGRTRPADDHDDHRRRTRRRDRKREVHHHHHDHDSTTRVTTTRSRRHSSSASGTSGEGPELYVTLGGGLTGFASPQISDKALPGLDYNVGVGVKGDWLAGEVGFTGAGYRLDPEGSSSNLGIGGLTLDGKLQPKLDFIEPYALLGVGFHSMYDAPVDERSSGGSLRMGAGVDFRAEHFGVGVRYLYALYSMEGETGVYGGQLEAAGESIGINVLYHF